MSDTVDQVVITPPPTLASTLRAPFIAWVRPYQAGQMLANLGWFPTLFLLGMGLVFLAAGLGVALYIDNYMQSHWGWWFWGSRDANAPAKHIQVMMAIGAVFERRDEAINLVGFCFGSLVFFSMVTMGSLVVAFPRVSRNDSVFAAVRRALHCPLAGVGFGVLCVLALGALLILADGPFGLEFMLMWTLLPLLTVAYFAIIARVADGHCPPPPVLDTPYCERCGYDLTSMEDHERCPECGTAIADSLNPSAARRDDQWTLHRNFGPTFWSILVRPGEFYGNLRVRRSLDQARPFAGYVGLTLFGGGIVAALVLMILVTVVHGGGAGVGELLFVIFAVSCWNLLGCQVGHALVTLAVLLYTRMTRPLPDDRWLAHAACYEWAMTWFVATFWGLTAMMFAVGDEPLTRIFGYVLGLPADLLWLFGGTFAIGLRWIVRWQKVIAAIRWSNF